MKVLPKTYNPKDVEDKIYRLWEESGYFNPDKFPKSRKKPYCIVIPPPNITGELHMGHALQDAIHDILIRQKRMAGYRTLWLPGTDHAGIATQNKVEKELKKQGLTRFDLGREEFIKRAWQWKEKYGNIILGQLKKLGCSCDWSRTKFTMDKEYAEAVKEAFQYYYKKGWIYRGERVVNWCPRCRTSLSDLEIEYKEEGGHLWYIRYPLLKIKNPGPAQGGDSPEGCKSKIKNTEQKLKIKDYIVVATTRPETMLGDTAVAVNPKDQRYKKLIGQKVVLPLVGREIPIIADRLVDPKFGTGAVKVTPAHDLADYEIGLRHNLEIFSVIDEAAEINKQAPLRYQGLKTEEAREKIVEDLKEQGCLEKIEGYLHQVPKCYRCGATVELIPSKQWFLKMDKLAQLAIKAVKNRQVKFHPARWERVYFDWLKNVRDWCISRQIWWGHLLPIWHCQIGKKSKILDAKRTPRRVANQKSKINNGEYFISLRKPRRCPICGECKPRQVEDVLDTWFSSALWPFATLGWPKKSSDLDRFYPTSILITARDIINLWVARMIFSGMEFMKRPPFKDVYIHPTILTREGKRMSKSLGTGKDPLELVEKYGADAVRFGLTWQISNNQDIRFVEDNIVMGRKFCNKIWNASRFVLLQSGKSEIRWTQSELPGGLHPKSEINPKATLRGASNQFQNSKLTTADKRILKALDKTIKSVNKDLEDFQFGKAAQTLYVFFWHDFCDFYVEKSKKQESRETKQILLYVLLASLKLLHPFMPFITEEIYQKLPVAGKKKCLMIEDWPTSVKIRSPKPAGCKADSP